MYSFENNMNKQPQVVQWILFLIIIHVVQVIFHLDLHLVVTFLVCCCFTCWCPINNMVLVLDLMHHQLGVVHSYHLLSSFKSSTLTEDLLSCQELVAPNGNCVKCAWDVCICDTKSIYQSKQMLSFNTNTLSRSMDRNNVMIGVPINYMCWMNLFAVLCINTGRSYLENNRYSSMFIDTA